MADLGKWPAMVVLGDKITEEQANEVLIRTMAREYFDMTNDHEWAATVREIFGKEDDYSLRNATFEERLALMRRNDALLDELGILRLEYLYNSRIASSYIGGPHGWLDWNGNISGNKPYNIGKWPDEGSILDEWTLIAETFPFLSLTAQYYSESPSEPGGELDFVFEVTVKDGSASVTDGVEFEEDDINYGAVTEEDIFKMVSDPYRERGVTEARLRTAVSQVRKSRGL